MMNRSLQGQNLPFGLMFALQFGALGCWLPVFTLHLQQTLGFDGAQIGMILGLSAASALFSPFLGVLISDRLLSPRSFLGVCHGIAAGMMFWCSYATGYTQVLLGMIFYQLVFTPSFALSNAIALRHLKGGRDSFGGVRVWGTVAWMAVAWILAVLLKFFPEKTSLALQASAWCSIAMVLLCFALPTQGRSVSLGDGILKVFHLPSGVWKFFLSPPVLMLSAGSFLISMTYRFHFTGGGPYLVGRGCSMEWVLPALSIGQILELWFLSRLKHTLKRWGYFGLMGLGAFISLVMFAVLALNPNLGWAIFFMMGHGVTFTYFSTSVLMWLDSKVEGQFHSSVHQLMIFIPSLAGVVGGYVSGWMLEPAESTGNYVAFYSVPAVAALVTLLLIIGAKRSSSA
jgi:hypothetical protein